MAAVFPTLRDRARRWRGPVLVAAVVLAAAALYLYLQLAGRFPVDPRADAGSFYTLAAEDLHGAPIDFASYRGQVTLVVNVASECGLAFQYPGLETLFRQYRDQGFTILAFPSNDFWQEPGTARDIEQACRLHGVSFPVFAKVGVRPGTTQSPVYAHLAGTGHLPLWNFGKYVVGRDGHVREFFGSLVAPDAPELHAAIHAALAEPSMAAGGHRADK